MGEEMSENKISHEEIDVELIRWTETVRSGLGAPSSFTARKRVPQGGLILYVRSDGDNKNDGLSDRPNGAFKDFRCAALAASKYDFDGGRVTLQAGTEKSPTVFASNVKVQCLMGGGTLLIKGAGSDRTIWTSNGGDTFTINNTGSVQVNFEAGSIRSAAHGIKVNYQSLCNIKSDVDFGNHGGHAIWVHDNQAICQILNSQISISGAMQSFLFIQYGHCFLEGSEIKGVDEASFEHGFITMYPRGSAQVIGNRPIGSAKGKRYNIAHLSLLNLGGMPSESQLLGDEIGIADASSVVM